MTSEPERHEFQDLLDQLDQVTFVRVVKKYADAPCSKSVSESTRRTGMLSIIAQEKLQTAAVTVAAAGIQTVEYLDLEEIAKNGIPPIPWLLQDWFAEHDVGLLVGAGGIGKSTTMFGMAVALAKGEDFCGLDVIRPVKVLYFDEEQGDRAMSTLAIKLDGINPNLKVASGQGIRLDTHEGIARLEREIRDWEPEVVMGDSVQRLFGAADENNATAVGLVYGDLFRLRDKYKVGFLFTHHKKKAQPYKVELIELVRGSTAHGTQASVVIYAEPGGLDCLNLVMAKRRGAPKQSLVVSYQETETGITLEGQGEVEGKETKISSCSEWLAREIIGPTTTAEIKGLNTRLDEPYDDRTLERAITHAHSIGAISKIKRGIYAPRAS